GKALLHVLRRALRGSVRIVIELIALAVGRVKISVAAQALVHLAAQEVVDRLLDRLPDDAPARHLQTADHAHERQVGAQAEARAIRLAPHRLDTEGIATCEPSREQILDHRGDDLRPEGRGIDLANPLDTAGGPELQEDEVAAAVGGRRITHDEYFDAV